jgi:predicted nucleic acid-binding protein
VRIVVDTGVFSAALSRRRRPEFETQVNRLPSNQLFLAVSTVFELRYGALVADWGEPRRVRLEEAIATTTVVPVSDALLTRMAELRLACRRAGHPLADPVHANDLWIAASTLHIDAGLVSADAIFDSVPGLDKIR